MSEQVSSNHLSHSSYKHSQILIITIFFALIIFSSQASADFLSESSDVHSPNDFGGIGLLQMPTARFSTDGQLSVGLSSASPYNYLYFTLQLLPWLETTFRYAQVTNREFAIARSSGGNQSLKDRGFDLKLRLLEESRYLPEVAVGLRDFLGTGLFAGEYIVATKNHEDFDFTLGLGWGRLGTQDHFGNPLGQISDRFNTRGDRSDEGGQVEVRSWFRGSDVALFGGVQWQTPIEGLRLKIEYDGNDYQSEPLANNQDVDSPINVGLVYRALNKLDVGLGYERGNTVTANLTTYLNLNQDVGPPKIDRPPVPIRSRLMQGGTDAPKSERELVKSLERFLDFEEFTLHAVDIQPIESSITVWFSQGRYLQIPQAVGRVARILSQIAPDDIERFNIVSVGRGLEASRVSVNRASLEAMTTDDDHRVAIMWRGVTVEDTETGYAHAKYNDLNRPYGFDWDFSPGMRLNIGGPDGFILGQILLELDASYQINRNWFVDGSVGVNLIDNLDDLGFASDSVLPHVRSDIALYLRRGKNHLQSLKTEYFWSPGKNLYARFSAGIFEAMYGGIAGELLYRKPSSRFAFGIDINRVRQREFEQRFSFRDYEVTTGHLTTYYDTNFHDFLVKFSMGRYLARDVGATLDLSREFANGARAGVYATKTDVSSEEFGEGSFDKGIYLSLPLDLFFADRGRNRTVQSFNPLTRDGGAKVNSGTPLYNVISDHGLNDFRRQRRAFLQ